MKIIAIIGQRGSGKSFLCKRLMEVLPNSTKMSFADGLKLLAQAHYSVTRETMDSLTFKETPYPTILNPIDVTSCQQIFGVTIPERHLYTDFTSPRHFMQYVGTEILRNIDPDIHIKRMVKEISNSKSDFVLIDDCRFQNEFNLLSGYDFVSAYLEHPNPIQNQGSLHPSESYTPQLVSQCRVQGTRSDLFNKIMEALNERNFFQKDE
jgi:energy-coupling factor transporter ATP-binding protein EcfA2